MKKMAKGIFTGVLTIAVSLMLVSGASAAQIDYCKDLDLDGYGDPTDCEREWEYGYVENNGDCDDTVASINPGVPETCFDEIDNNCVNGIDEGCSAGAKQYYYLDSDNDGYGNPNVWEYATNPSAGYVDDSSDCNDQDFAIKPGAQEIYDGLIDNDCDGALLLFPDPNLEACVLYYTNGSYDPMDLLNLGEIYCSSITDITGVEYLTGLIKLGLTNSAISDLSPLANANLPVLRELDFRTNAISDLSPLATANLPSLWRLNLPDNTISDLSPLATANLPSLSSLNLNMNVISDISHLANLNFSASLPNLRTIALGWNGISDISPLANANFNANFPYLSSIGLYHNAISDISPLANANLPSLEHIWLQDNSISNIPDLGNLTSLVSLDLSDNSINNLAPLANLKGLTYLGLNGNSLIDISQLANLTGLNKLYLDNNSITNLAPMAYLTSLNILFFNNNFISDLSPLTYLTELEWVSLWYNCITDFTPVSHVSLVRGNDPQYQQKCN